MTEIKTWIIENYQLLIFFFGLFLGALSIVIGLVRKTIEVELKTMRKDIDNGLNNIKAHNTQLAENIDSIRVYQNINTAISYDTIQGLCVDSESTKRAAKALLSFHETNGITIPNWKEYGIPKELIVEMEIILLKKEVEKLEHSKTEQ
jgi:uncharacterized membrane-anchored protein YhcB (DUF1043 family)